jgi:invasion protein IalB
MKTLPVTIPLVLLALAAAPIAPASAQTTEPGSVRTGTFGDWFVHENAGEGPKICFAASQPKSKEPAGANRSRIVLYVSAWPKEGVKSEVSIKLGYPIKPDSQIAVSVGDAEFELFPDQDRAYVADATEELKLVEAMKKGSTLVVKATSARGTQTTDTYSLIGLGRALEAIAAACPS